MVLFDPLKFTGREIAGWSILGDLNDAQAVSRQPVSSEHVIWLKTNGFLKTFIV